jgi:diguanylate cyclase (GGDEF)-like protein
MKLRNKILVAIGFAWLVFLTITYSELSSLIPDINQQPHGMLRNVSKPYGFIMGLEAIHYYLVIYLLAAISFSLLMALLMRILVIQRLEKLDKELSIISSTHAITSRVTVVGNDELSSVAKEINNLMAMIQASQEHLEHSVDKRTQELKNSNQLLQQEIRERKSIENELLINKEHLVRLAHYDNLTALPNRMFFNEILNKALSIAARQNTVLAILFIDLDRFKNINDALGHSTGDVVLKEIARRFTGVLRSSDTLARLGGDEFILLLNDIHYAKFASQIAEKILKISAEAINVDSHVFFVSASIGIAVYPSDGTSLEDLQKNADAAMYKAKRMGGGVFHYFTKEMNTEAYKHIQLESSLRKAIKQHEFELYYQPKLDLKLGKMTGVEALIRWNNPDLGLIDPINFIPLAEETGLIMQIGEWSLRKACETNKRWQNLGYEPICVSVNLSAKQFQHKDIAKLVADILKETGLEAKYLDLEITETAVMENVDSAIKRLNEIKQMGVEISVDDFGMGYSSISYLKQFPVTVLKIDQSFIKGIPHKQNDMAITTAMIAMAHNLGMKVVAEGVETLEQMEYLAAHDCDMIQGYFISRPLPEKKIVLQFSGGPATYEA